MCCLAWTIALRKRKRKRGHVWLNMNSFRSGRSSVQMRCSWAAAQSWPYLALRGTIFNFDVFGVNFYMSQTQLGKAELISRNHGCNSAKIVRHIFLFVAYPWAPVLPMQRSLPVVRIPYPSLARSEKLFASIKAHKKKKKVWSIHIQFLPLIEVLGGGGGSGEHLHEAHLRTTVIVLFAPLSSTRMESWSAFEKGLQKPRTVPCFRVGAL